MTDNPDIAPENVALMLDGVTPGPWQVFIDDSGGKWGGWPLSIEATNFADKCIVRPGGQWPYEWDAGTSRAEAVANACFIAYAREAVPALAARVAELEAEQEKTRRFLKISRKEGEDALVALEAAEAALAAAVARVERLRSLVQVAAEARLLIDTGFSEIGDTINYRPSVIEKVCDMLEPHTLEGDKP